MNVLIRFFILLILPFVSKLSAVSGLVTILEKGREDALFFSLIRHIYNLDSRLPVEIWVEEKAFSEEQLQSFLHLPGVSLMTYPQSEKLKLLYACEHTRFDRFVFCDTDVVFIKDPQVLLLDPAYREKGALFFKNHLPKNLEGSEGDYRDRCAYLKCLCKELSPFLKKMPFDFYKKLGSQLTIFAKDSSSFASSSLFVWDQKKMRGLFDMARILQAEKKYQKLKEIDLIWLAVLLKSSSVEVSSTSEVSLPSVEPGIQMSGQLYRGELLCLSSNSYNGVKRQVISDFTGKIERNWLPNEKEALETLFETYDFLTR